MTTERSWFILRKRSSTPYAYLVHNARTDQIGVITYGRVASNATMRRASPIIAQIPFADREAVMEHLREQYDSLAIGVGTAASAGGMAVLEALVAAIEVNIRF